MSKRLDAIRSMMAAPATLSADNKARVASGSVRSLADTFSHAERENEELRRQMASGLQIVELDPSLIDPSPVPDRFAEHDDASFEALKTSIAQRGQEVPVLVREYPGRTGRYQTAYGHRRVRAARELGRPVRAVIRFLSDQDLIVAQGVENAAREDLSFIERAVFAARLEDGGHDRSVIQEALAIDRAEASKLIAVARGVPRDIAEAIGRAPKVGRGRWQALADVLKDDAALARARAAVREAGFGGPSDERFLALSQAAATKPSVAASRTVYAGDKPVARLMETPREIRLTIGREGGFAAYLVERLPSLFEAYASDARRED